MRPRLGGQSHTKLRTPRAAPPEKPLHPGHAIRHTIRHAIRHAIRLHERTRVFCWARRELVCFEVVAARAFDSRLRSAQRE